ncbi:transglutaminase domain-containing protein [Bacteroides sp. 51]|uniref:transglutaminase domain-containing protein n=1 Tax=Bacteroides sp. 51 TaxID=2302938 RepID=UPI0013D31493|nr:transglutaminase domain-containing protein [Bacteroides sp. 51]NDV81664.1 hypothetical protein [Bacteroides sp. 51]
MMKIIPRVIILLLILFSCKKEPDHLQDALNESGVNRSELECVLQHYQNDSIKLRAAFFLLFNMKGLHTLDGNSMDVFYCVMDSLRKSTDEMNVFDRRSFYGKVLKGSSLSDLQKKYDLNQIKASDLTRRIDHAFKVWKMPWAKDLSFDDFCEYLLPHRVGTEVLENWEQDYSDYFQSLLDHVDLDSDSAMYKVCGNLSEKIKWNTYSYPVNMPNIKPSILKYQKIGTCEEFANLFVFVGRTFGIPAAIDFTPQWANHSMGHVWSVVIHNNETLYYMIGEGVPRPAHDKRFTYKLPKVYRRTYGIQSHSLAMLASNESLPLFFRNPRMKDVTEEYIPTKNLQVEDLNKVSNKGKRIYAAVFDDKNWIPVAWGNIEKKNKGTIPNIGYPAIYLPIYYIDGQCVAAQYPVRLDEQGCHSLIPEKEKLQTVVLKRKFMDNRAWEFVEMIKGGRFQVADNINFKNAKEFGIPDTVGYNYQTINVSDGNKYRYIRYIPLANTTGCIAEIEVYSKDDIQRKGKIIGTYTHTSDTIHGMEKVFDGKTLSYAICNKERNDQWIGLDLGEPVEVSKIVYLPRSDDNFIKDRELYELFFWDNKWTSLGKQMGNKQTQCLVYDNVPSNSLLLLRNLTKGKEERIFTYENGQQVWW